MQRYAIQTTTGALELCLTRMNFMILLLSNMHHGMLDKDAPNLGNIRTSLAQTHYQMGSTNKTDSLFRKWLKLEPDWGWGWIGWSDCYWLWDFGQEKDLDKAEKILRQGLSVSNVMDDDFIEERFNDLLEEKNKVK